MFEKHSNGKMASNKKPTTTKRDTRILPQSLIEKENRLKTFLLKLNYKGFYQHNEHTAGVAQVCQPHFTYLGVEVIVLHTFFKAQMGSFYLSLRGFVF